MASIPLLQSEFLEMLQTVIDVVPTNAMPPVLENVLLTAEGGSCSLAATDLDISITTKRPLEVSEEGSMLFPARKMYSIVRELASGSLTLSEQDGRVTLKSATGEYSMATMPVEEFPTIPTEIEGTTLALGGERLKRMIGKATFAVHVDQFRPILSGVSWRVWPTAVEMISTDGHRLAKITHRFAYVPERAVQVIVPPHVFKQVVKLVGAGNALQRITVAERQIHFAHERADVVARLIEGTYVDVDAVIPKGNERHMIVSAASLIPAIRRLQVLASQQNHQVKFSLKQNELELTTLNRETGAEARESIKVEYENNPMAIGYNANYLQEVLTKIDSDRVRFKFGHPESAAIIEPAEQLDGEEYFCLLMPLRLTDA